MLDSKTKVKQLDKKDMLGTIEHMPKQLLDGLRRGRMSGLPRFSPKEVVICGMGGSAIGGDLLREWLLSTSSVPCEVCRSYSLPAWIGRDSLVIVASYSGNTQETISMFEDAGRRRAKLVAISSGGQLAKLSESQSIPHARVPSGLVPRASLGYMFGAMLGVLERSGIVTADKQIEEAVRVLGSSIAYCKQSVPTQDNPAKMLAHELFACVPVVFGYELSRPVAKRWANQLNENGKSLAFSCELPEMNHNEIVGWAKDPRGRGFSAVFLENGAEGREMKERVRATKEMVARAAHVYTVESVGLSPLAKMVSLILIGDYTSAYLGILKNEDPSSNEAIDELKETLSKK